jgi:hypothetical protein
VKNNILAALLLCAASAACAQSVEYLRPTADVNGTTPVYFICPGCTYNNSSSMNGVYTNYTTGVVKTGVGPNTTGSGFIYVVNNTSPAAASGRVFYVWQSPTTSYTSLTLNASTQCSITDHGDGAGGTCSLYYSTDGALTWTLFYTFGSMTSGSDATVTTSVSISPGTSFSSLVILAMVVGADDGGAAGDDASLTVNDIWTAGTYGSSGHVIPPQIISKLHNPVRGYLR